jgi:hypothetical protein
MNKKKTLVLDERAIYILDYFKEKGLPYTYVANRSLAEYGRQHQVPMPMYLDQICGLCGQGFTADEWDERYSDEHDDGADVHQACYDKEYADCIICQERDAVGGDYTPHEYTPPGVGVDDELAAGAIVREQHNRAGRAIAILYYMNFVWTSETAYGKEIARCGHKSAQVIVATARGTTVVKIGTQYNIVRSQIVPAGSTRHAGRSGQVVGFISSNTEFENNQPVHRVCYQNKYADCIICKERDAVGGGDEYTPHAYTPARY